MLISKRNHLTEEFKWEKIYKAVKRAFNSTNTHFDDDIFEGIKEHLSISDGMSVEDIQDQIEASLYYCGYSKVGHAYTVYREEHAHNREILSRIQYMDTYIHSSDNAATASETDPNANVTMKNVSNLEGEVYKENNRKIQRLRMKIQLNKQFPEIAKQYIDDLESHIIYTNDEASSPCPKFYCCAVSLYPLMLEGVGNIDGVTPGPPSDIKSFSGQLTNLVFLLSSQAKGAVALGEYFIALNLYVIAEFGNSWYEHLDDVITSPLCLQPKTVRDAIYAGFKQFVYGINQPAGNRGFQSPSNKN